MAMLTTEEATERFMRHLTKGVDMSKIGEPICKMEPFPKWDEDKMTERYKNLQKFLPPIEYADDDY